MAKRQSVSSEDDDNRRVLGAAFDSPEGRQATEDRRRNNVNESRARRGVYDPNDEFGDE